MTDSPSPSVAAPPQSAWRRALPGLVLIAAIFLAYARVWHAGFIWDDDDHLTRNPCIVGPLGFSAIWTTSRAVYYPLVLTSFWVQHAVWGLNPLPYHVVDVALHALCALLLWRVLRRLNVAGAWLGAAIWALHPVQVESAAWITEQKNTQSGCFYLLAILFFLGWRRADQAPNAAQLSGFHRSRNYGGALLCATLAILSKSSTVMLPVVLGLCWWWMDGRWRWRNVFWLAPFLMVSGAASAWTVWEQKNVQRADGVAWSQGWPERAVVAGKDIWFYLWKLVWPHPLIFIYPTWNTDPSRLTAFLPLEGAAAALFLLWLGRDGRMRPVFFAAAYYVISLFPVMSFFNVYFFRYTFVGDHFQYLAGIGPLALAGAAITSAMRRTGTKAYAAASAVLLVVLGTLSWAQSAIYSDIGSLWRATVAGNPGSSMAHLNLGNYLLQEGQREAATAQYQAAVEADPTYSKAHDNLGLMLFGEGRIQEAVAEYREALRIDPDDTDGLYDLGNALFKQGENEQAIAQYRAVLRLNPESAPAHGNLGAALLQQGHGAEAVAEIRESLRLDPNNAESHNNMGLALSSLGQTEEEIAELHEALRLKPDYAEAHNNLGAALAAEGQTQGAIAEFREAARIDPNYTTALCNLGNALLGAGETAAAIAQVEKALQLQPASPAIQNALAWMLAAAPQTSLRDGGRAVQLAVQASRGSASPAMLRTLAAAYAQAGQFPDAVQTAEEALRLARAQSNAWFVHALPREIALYEAGRPYEEPR